MKIYIFIYLLYIYIFICLFVDILACAHIHYVDMSLRVCLELMAHGPVQARSREVPGGNR